MFKQNVSIYINIGPTTIVSWPLIAISNNWNWSGLLGYKLYHTCIMISGVDLSVWGVKRIACANVLDTGVSWAAENNFNNQTV